MDLDTSISAESLKAQGLTDEDLQAVMPQEDAQEPAQDAVTEQPIETPEQETSQAVDDTNSVEAKQSLKPTVVSYDRFKEANEKAKALAAELAALKAQAPAQEPKTVFEQPKPSPANPIEAKQKYFAMLSGTADKEAREICGIVDQDPMELQFVDNAKYQMYLDTRATIVAEKHAENVKAFAIRQQNETYVGKLQNDPLFAPVYQFANEAMQDLPGRELLKFKEAEARVTNYAGTDADFTLLDKYLDTYRAKYLAATGQAAPVVATAQAVKAPLDKAEGLPRASNLSGAKTAAMSWAQVEQLIRDGKADQIPKEMLAMIDPHLIE